MKKYITTFMMLLLVGTGLAHAQSCVNYNLSYAVYASESAANFAGDAAYTPGTGSVSINGNEQSTQVCHRWLAGGDCAQWVTQYDSGTVSITVNGFVVSTTYNQNSTSSTIASALAAAFNANSSSPVTASASGSVVSVSANTPGAGSNYTLSATSANATSTLANLFGGPSFTASPSGSALTGGTNGNATGHILTSVLTDGSASMSVNTQYDWCQGAQQQLPTATHTPYATNTVNGVGGSNAGTSQCVTCYLSYQNNEDSGAVPVGQEVSFDYSGSVQCSIGGLIYAFGGPSGSLRIAISNYLYVNTIGGVCTYGLYCVNGTATCGYPTVEITACRVRQITSLSTNSCTESE